MNIVFLSMHPGFGGAQTANCKICEMLADNFNVFYFEEFVESLPIDKKSKVEIVKVDLYRNRFKPWILLKQIQQFHPDYVLIGMPFVLIYYFLPLTLLRIKGINIGLLFHSLGLTTSIKDKIAEKLIALSSFLLSDLIFVSEFTRKSWCKYFMIRCASNKHHVIYNPIPNLDFCHFESRNVFSNIGFVGRLSDEKQPSYFCNLAKNMNLLGYPYKFFVFGDGPLLHKLKREFSNYVIFQGYESNLDKIYSNLDLLIVTSKFENCPMIILEAFSRGIPCIAPNVGGIPELLDNNVNGIMYDKFDIELLQKYIIYIINNYNSFSKEALRKSYMFSYRNILKKWNNILYKY